MRSARPKPLHLICGRPMVMHVIHALSDVAIDRTVVVVGHGAERVTKKVQEQSPGWAHVTFVEQTVQRGTGDAAMVGMTAIPGDDLDDDSTIIVLPGDTPLLRAETVEQLVATHLSSGNAATAITSVLDDPTGYGRVLRAPSKHGDGRLLQVIEQRDAAPEIHAIREVWTSMCAFRRDLLGPALRRLSPDNAQGEYYLTDLLAVLRDAGQRVGAYILNDPVEALGVNSRAELATVEQEIQRRVVEKLMKDGVTFRNPATVVIDSTVTIGADSVVYPFVTLEGTTKLGEGCVVEPGVHLINVTVGDDVHLKTGTVAEETTIEDEATIGPYAHLRPGTQLGRKVKVGNFVETKKAIVGEGSKLPHLSYIGDAEIGAGVNIGAGTITCNYDGVNKNKTVIEDGVFIGSDSQLVAPIRIGRGAYVGAGSTITKDVPPDALALTRSPQKTIDGWAARKREERAKK